MRWKLIGCPVFYLADFSSWVWYRCLYTISCPATATEIPGVLASYFLWWIRLDPTPSLFTWRAFHKAADITLHVDLQCNFCFRLGSVLASSWWLGTKEEFHEWHHLVEDVILKLKANMSIVDPSVFSKLALSQISVPYLQTLVTRSLFYDSVQILGIYTLSFPLSSHPVLFISIHSLSYNCHCSSPELC